MATENIFVNNWDNFTMDVYAIVYRVNPSVCFPFQYFINNAEMNILLQSSHPHPASSFGDFTNPYKLQSRLNSLLYTLEHLISATTQQVSYRDYASFFSAMSWSIINAKYMLMKERTNCERVVKLLLRFFLSIAKLLSKRSIHCLLLSLVTLLLR